MSGLKVLAVDCDLPAALDELVPEDGGSGAKGRGKKRGRSEMLEVLAFQAPEGRRFRRFLYVKAHGGAGSDSAGVTLFVANVAQGWGVEQLRRIFEQFGTVQSVNVGKANRCRFARVTFASGQALGAVLERASDGAERKLSPLRLADDASSAGRKTRLPRWLEQYDAERPGLAELKAETETYMVEFARLEAEETARRKELEKQADADGFTTVNYKKGSKARTAASLAADTLAVAGGQQYLATVTGATRNLVVNKKKKVKDLKDFYRFQQREKKRDQLADLREKFEQDKAHIMRLKAARKFNPFK